MRQKHSEQGPKDVAIPQDSFISSNFESIIMNVFIQLMMLGRCLLTYPLYAAVGNCMVHVISVSPKNSLMPTLKLTDG